MPASADPAHGVPTLPARGAGRGRLLRSLGVLLALCLSLRLDAIIFYVTDDPSYNTSAPTGALAGSGWELQGQWIGNGPGYCGTPIAPRYFLAAKHVGGTNGSPFTFGGVTYSTTAFFDDPLTDLRLWRVCGSFPQWASLYTNHDEAGRELIAFGRGTLRGAAVSVASPGGELLKGWEWGAYDGVLRWGQNHVADIVDGNLLGGTNNIGELLRATFDADAGTNECHLSFGDSSGAVFIHDDTGWKLAGIHYSVDGPYKTSAEGSELWAALFDQGGLYIQEDSDWKLLPEGPPPQPGSFYSTRVSARIDWIQQILAQPIPADTPGLEGSAEPGGPYQAEVGVATDESAKTLTLARPTVSRFFRLRACEPTIISDLTVADTNLVIHYDYLERP